ncbi:YbaB/EbfC family nucleoid-associated protein [Saccharothrix sp. S26]|uniref:YbaB/EbfC family nucleoid-associated protein n=1 Tax=Saccharothrix sp. S26 TaxID=2907215 RepID=UPI001F2B4CB1|nr:YbaB/EbfC family nucleoid-associated protein [Saccharothrix sp. S26]MCE6993987.1 YbaB/EbfC family nucleoid-associated protein [Saccharothrix sp. S26]
MTESADILVRRIEALDTAAADNRLRAESLRRMTEGLRDVVGTATSGDGLVSVVAGSDGAVKSISFGPAVRTTDPAALSSATLRVIALARADAARRQAEVVRSALGDTKLLDQVLAEDRRVFGDEPPGEPPVAVPPRVIRRVAPVEDEEPMPAYRSHDAW